MTFLAICLEQSLIKLIVSRRNNSKNFLHALTESFLEQSLIKLIVSRRSNSKNFLHALTESFTPKKRIVDQCDDTLFF